MLRDAEPEKLDQFLDDLADNPYTPAPNGLDAETVHLLRALVSARTEEAPDDDQQHRLWNQVLFMIHCTGQPSVASLAPPLTLDAAPEPAVETHAIPALPQRRSRFPGQPSVLHRWARLAQPLALMMMIGMVVLLFSGLLVQPAETSLRSPGLTLRGAEPTNVDALIEIIQRSRSHPAYFYTAAQAIGIYPAEQPTGYPLDVRARQMPGHVRDERLLFNAPSPL